MLRNLSIVIFLGLAACGGTKSQAQDPATTENTSTATSTPASSTQCCCQTEMHSCSMKEADACEEDDGNCNGMDADHCDCMGDDADDE